MGGWASSNVKPPDRSNGFQGQTFFCKYDVHYKEFHRLRVQLLISRYLLLILSSDTSYAAMQLRRMNVFLVKLLVLYRCVNLIPCPRKGLQHWVSHWTQVSVFSVTVNMWHNLQTMDSIGDFFCFLCVHKGGGVGVGSKAIFATFITLLGFLLTPNRTRAWKTMFLQEYAAYCAV